LAGPAVAANWHARDRIRGGLNGLLLLIEALRGDSLVLPGGICTAQVFGLALMLAVVYWAQGHAQGSGFARPAEAAPPGELQSQP
jgi:hypothetical protein